MLSLSIVLAIVTLLASIGLLTLSGWLLSASAVAETAGLYSPNYALPAASMRDATVIRTAGCCSERLVNHGVTLRVLQHLCVYTFSKLLPPSLAGLARCRQGELPNRVAADISMFDYLYLYVTSPLVGAFVMIMAVTVGLSFLDLTLTFTLDGTILLMLFLMPPLLYRAGKDTGQNLIHLHGQYHQQLTAWLQGQAELIIFGVSDRCRM